MLPGGVPATAAGRAAARAAQRPRAAALFGRLRVRQPLRSVARAAWHRAGLRRSVRAGHAAGHAELRPHAVVLFRGRPLGRRVRRRAGPRGRGGRWQPAGGAHPRPAAAAELPEEPQPLLQRPLAHRLGPRRAGLAPRPLPGRLLGAGASAQALQGGRAPPGALPRALLHLRLPSRQLGLGRPDLFRLRPPLHLQPPQVLHRWPGGQPPAPAVADTAHADEHAGRRPGRALGGRGAGGARGRGAAAAAGRGRGPGRRRGRQGVAERAQGPGPEVFPAAAAAAPEAGGRDHRPAAPERVPGLLDGAGPPGVPHGPGG
mmetsp:Transcript_4335/g.13535  ORF Transcript_4335/g.13535 Transcript_4335/m.13535 type:complete len:316 (+) Transcript_4335:317-1264(+)